MLARFKAVLAGQRKAPEPPPRPEQTFASWDDALRVSDGYAKEVILQRAMTAALAVKRGEAAFERDTVLFKEAAYRWQLLACVACAAASKAGSLHVLDVGGSVASVYLQHRRFLDAIPGLRWSIVEQSHLVAAARDALKEDRLSFFDSIGAACTTGPVDFTLLSSSLQYMRDPPAVLREVAETLSSRVVIDRIPLLPVDEDSIVVQHVPADIYPASYPVWRLSEARVLARMREHGYREVARYNDGIDSSAHVGLLFERSPARGT